VKVKHLFSDVTEVDHMLRASAEKGGLYCVPDHWLQIENN